MMGFGVSWEFIYRLLEKGVSLLKILALNGGNGLLVEVPGWMTQGWHWPKTEKDNDSEIYFERNGTAWH
jgi:hypothetical protein